MAEIGIDLASAAHFPGVSYRDWTLPDPAGQPPATVRSIRDEIAQRVRVLISELLATPTARGNDRKEYRHVPCATRPQCR
jgi:hypothetical protein